MSGSTVAATHMATNGLVVQAKSFFFSASEQYHLTHLYTNLWSMQT
jgi:hypothetical protein